MPPSLLINERPLIVLPSLAKLIGLNEAIVIQQLHFYLTSPKSGVELNGERWIYNTYAEWQAEAFPFWSVDTIKRTLLRLEEMLIVVACQPDGRESRRKYYRLNRGMIPKLNFDNVPPEFPDEGKMPRSAPEGGILPRSEGGKLPLSCARASNIAETSTETSPLTPQGGDGGEQASAAMSKANKARLPSSEPAKRIATLFHRRLTTPWSEKEIRSFKKLLPIDLEELELLEGYYAAEREKGDEGIHRRDLFTFLNNWRGEMDRANAWKKVSPNGHRSAITSENALSLPKR